MSIQRVDAVQGVKGDEKCLRKDVPYIFNRDGCLLRRYDLLCTTKLKSLAPPHD